MAPGYAGHHRPLVATSKIDIRYPPNIDGDELVRKVRNHLNENGYEDVDLHRVGDYPWSWGNGGSEIAQAGLRMFRQFGVPYNQPPKGNFLGYQTGGGPNYLFTRDPLRLPLAQAGLGYGWGAHSDPEGEYYVIQGDGEKIFGFAGAMKAYATVLYNYAGKNPASKESSP